MKKQIVLATIFVILLNSCAPNATSNVTVTSEVTVTSTFTPAPTATPTITPTPTNTPDPNMPAGAIGKYGNRYYKDVEENGKIVRYFWIDYNYGIKGWFTSHILDGNLINGGIPLIDGFGMQMIPFYFYTQEGLQTPFIRHPQNPHDPYAPDFSKLLYSYLMEKYFDKSFLKITSDEQEQFYPDFQNGKVSFSFSTPTGNYVWRLSKTTGYKFYAVKWDNADPAIHPEFYETSGGGYIYRWTVFSDSEGNLVGFVAEKHKQTKDSEILLEDDNGVLFLIFVPVFQMLSLKQLPAKIKYWQDIFSSNLVLGSALESKCTQVNILNPDRTTQKTVNACITPHFEIVRNP